MVLTGRETAPATFAARAHLNRDRPALVDVRTDGSRHTTSWGRLARRVRHLSLALSAEGFEPGVTLALDGTARAADRATTLLVGSAIGAVVVAGAGATPLDLDALAVAGAALDERHPDGFERLVAARSPHEPLLRCGEVDHTHASLLIAARSLAQGAGFGVADRLLVSLAPGSAAEVVLSVLVPCLTGAASWSSPTAFAVEDRGDDVRPTFIASRALSTQAGPTRRRVGRRRPRGAIRSVMVLGDGGAGGPLVPTGAGLVALSVEAAGGIVAGFGAGGSVGHPLPGVSLAVDDDGEVLVRSGGVPPGAPGLRDDGWLATGRHGRLDGGALVLERALAGPDGRAG